jgi:tetratricopeptide (TPR) repeat protein
MLSWIRQIFSSKDTRSSTQVDAALLAGYRQQGEDALGSGKLQEALACYEEAVACFPDYAPFHCRLGYVYHELGQSDQARSYLRYALQADPASADAHYFLGVVEQHAGHAVLAENHFQCALKHAPDFESAYCSYLQLLISVGKEGQAIELARKGCSHCPESAELHFLLGRLNYLLGRLEGASNALQRVVELVPGHVAALTNLGLLHIQANRLNEARNALDQALVADPAAVEPNYLLSVLCQMQGDIDAAMSACQVVLTQQAEHVGAWRLFGRMSYGRGEADVAIDCCRRVLEIAPGDVESARLLGQVFQDEGRYAQAIEHYRQMLQIYPANPDWHVGLGIACLSNKLPQDALAAFQQVLLLEPDHIVALHSCGVALQELSDWSGAAGYFRRALEIDSGRLDSLASLGVSLFREGKYEAALIPLRHALSLRNDLVYLHYIIGGVHQARLDWESAVAAFRRALRIDGNHVESLINLAQVLHSQDKSEEAIAALDHASAVSPDNVSVWINLGFICHAVLRDGDARRAYRRALSLAPPTTEVLIGMGRTCLNLLSLAEARSYFEQALRHEPESFDAKMHHALLMLLLGDMENGWREYEHRLSPSLNVRRPEFERNAWRNDADVRGKVIVLFSDQGAGDTLQFVRYARKVAELGGIVHLEVQEPLQRLLSNLPGVAGVSAQWQKLPDFDYCCPLSSLPYAFGTRLESVPTDVPYIVPPPEAVATWKSRLETRFAGNLPRVGVVWAGNPMFSNDRARSMALKEMLPLFERNDCNFVLLQKDVRERDVPYVPFGERIVDAGPELHDFSETAALIANLDLVVSVDTAVAHLVGAMNVPLWLTLPFAPDFRWLTERSDSPWYPSARLFRQVEPGNWKSVVDMLCTALDARFGDR